MGKVTSTLSTIGKRIAEANERAIEREQEYVSQDQFHAVSYGEAQALLHIRGYYHQEFRCPICRNQTAR